MIRCKRFIQLFEPYEELLRGKAERHLSETVKLLELGI